MMLFLVLCLVVLSHGFTAREVLEMRQSCSNMCAKHDTPRSCERSCIEGMREKAAQAPPQTKVVAKLAPPKKTIIATAVKPTIVNTAALVKALREKQKRKH